MNDYDDNTPRDFGDGQPALRTLVQRALARGLFIEVPYAQPLGDDNEQQSEFDSLIPGAGRLIVELWSEGHTSWRAAATWTPWAELQGRARGEWTRTGGDGIWTLPEDAIVEALYAIAPCAGMPPLDLLRRREPTLAELEAAALAMRVCSDGQLPLAMARQFVARLHGWADWNDMLRTKRSYGFDDA